MKQERKRDAVWFGAAFGLVLLVALAFGLVQLFAGGWGEQASLPQELGLDGTLEKPAAFWDGHWGFHGDGTAYWEIAFSPEEAAALEKSLQTAQGWHALPLDNDVRYLLYGTEGIEKAQDGAYISVNPYLTGKDGGPLFPQVEEGYWFFCDEQTESYTAQGVMERPSQNFTAAVYDSQSRTLYCGELDT